MLVSNNYPLRRPIAYSFEKTQKIQRQESVLSKASHESNYTHILIPKKQRYLSCANTCGSWGWKDIGSIRHKTAIILLVWGHVSSIVKIPFVVGVGKNNMKCFSGLLYSFTHLLLPIIIIITIIIAVGMTHTDCGAFWVLCIKL